MVVVEPGKGRAIIEPFGGGMRITIPGRGAPLITAFLGVWLAGWALGEFVVARTFLFGLTDEPVSTGARIVAVPWLLAWTLGGAWAASIFLWNLAGKEIIELDGTTLKRRIAIPLASRSREFAVASIAGLRPQPAAPSYFPLQQTMTPLSFRNGTIAFDYGLDTHHLATGLDAADAKYVAAELARCMSSLSAKTVGDAARRVER